MSMQQVPEWSDPEVPEEALDAQGVSRRNLIRGAGLLGAGFAATAVGDPDGARGIFAAAFPLSSPFAMLARAAEQPDRWPHLVALVWQAIWVALILLIGARMFRKSVLKSGPMSRRRPPTV